MSNPNIIQLAVKAAGGAPKVARAVSLHTQAVHNWGMRKSMPAEYVRVVCEMGGNAISVDQVLHFMERARKAKTEAKSAAEGA